MESILKNEQPTKRQLYLNPQSKIFLCLTVALITLMDGNSTTIKGLHVLVAIVPILFFIAMGKLHIALYYGLLYGFSMTVPYWIAPRVPAVINLLFTGVIFTSTQAIPSMSMCCVLIMTTSVSEFIAAMDWMHIPKKVTVPISSMFRFFPTIKDEYSAIRDSMRLRKIGCWYHPLELLEYRMVPLLMELVNIGNELSAAAMTKGLDAPNRRTNMCPVKFHWQDFIAVTFCFLVIGIFISASVFHIEIL